jgi:putative thioredoxin
MSNDENNSATSTSGSGYSASFGGESISAAPTPSAPKAATKMPAVQDITTASFAEDVIAASGNQLVLVDFWAPWCGPCKQLGPLLEKVVADSNGTVILAKMDIDKHPEVAGQMGIKSIPAVVAFIDGKPVDAFMGAVPESQIVAFIKKQPAPANPQLSEEDTIEASLAEAAELLAKGEPAPAADLYAAILGKEQGNLDAIAGLGECYLAVGEMDHARNIIAALPEDQLNVPAVAAFIGKLELAEQTATLGSTVDLEKKLAENPKDHQARFDLALVFNANNQRDEAAEQLLEIVRMDRKWNDDGAREQLLQFFDIWGQTDPSTLKGRRGLSSILFS